MPSHVLLISGSLRAGSVNGAVLNTAAETAPVGIAATLYNGMATLPHFNPDDDREPLHPAVAALRQALSDADAVLFCTPEYAGALPGSFKNLLDWSVGSPDMSGKPVAWINASSPAAPAGGEDAHASLRKVLGYLTAVIVEEACMRIPLSRQSLDTNGLIPDPTIRSEISRALQALTDAAQSRDPADRQQ